MARIIGIDLGAYSVKVAVANPGFRSASISEFIERPVPPGEGPFLERAVAVLAGIVREFNLGNDTHYVAVTGDRIFIHVLEFPFKSLRRAELDKAVGAELEGILPIDLDDMVYAFEQIPRDLGGSTAGPAEGEDPSFVPRTQHGMVAAPAEGMRVLSCAMDSERAQSFLELLRRHGIDARGLLAGPESYSRVLGKLPALEGYKEPVAVVDIGHLRTDVCVVYGGHTVFARTLARGGKDCTEAIAKNWKLPFDQAENAKHQDGYIGSSAQPPPTEAWQRIHNALLAEMAPLARDLKQTLLACRAKTGATVGRVILVGGGSRLRGCADFLAERLGVSVATLTERDHDHVMGGRNASGADVACLSVGIALDGATGRPVFDLRKGDIAYKADLSIIRAKAMPLAVALFVVLGFATTAGFMKMRTLKKAEAVLVERLAVETTEVFGKQLDADEVLAQAVPGGPGASPLPRFTAYDLLLTVNENLPPKNEVNIDVRDLTIKGGKITLDIVSRPTDKLQGSEGISEVEKTLKKVECFESVSRGDSTTEDEDARRVTITIALKQECR